MRDRRALCSGAAAARAALLLLVLLLGTPGCPASEEPPAPKPLPERLGMSEAQLRAEFGDALRAVKVEQSPGITDQILETRRHAGGVEAPTPAAQTPDPFEQQLRLAREVRGEEIQRVEYELFRGKLYRIRWQLSERYESPLMDPLVAHLSGRFGKPVYDQRIEAKFGSGKATLRRTAWRRPPRLLELRQLHPSTGGPLYLTLSDQPALQEIIAARGAVLPEPDSSGPWWQEPQKTPAIPGPAERDALLEAFDVLLERVEF